MSCQLLIFLLGSLLITNAFSCNCFSHLQKKFSFQENYNLSPLVIEAKVISQALTVQQTIQHGIQPYDFELLHTFKGCPPGKTFSGMSLVPSGMCGVDLKVGESYILFLRDGPTSHPRFIRHGFHLNQCQYNLPSKSLTEAQLSYIQSMSAIPSNTCVWDFKVLVIRP